MASVLGLEPGGECTVDGDSRATGVRDEFDRDQLYIDVLLSATDRVADFVDASITSSS